VFDIIEPFADYGSQGDAYGYGLMRTRRRASKRTSVEYLADPPDRSRTTRTARRLPERVPSKKITVDVPDVNRSASDFSVNGA